MTSNFSLVNASSTTKSRIFSTSFKPCRHHLHITISHRLLKTQINTFLSVFGCRNRLGYHSQAGVASPLDNL